MNVLVVVVVVGLHSTVSQHWYGDRCNNILIFILKWQRAVTIISSNWSWQDWIQCKRNYGHMRSLYGKWVERSAWIGVRFLVRWKQNKCEIHNYLTVANCLLLNLHGCEVECYCLEKLSWNEFQTKSEISACKKNLYHHHSTMNSPRFVLHWREVYNGKS